MPKCGKVENGAPRVPIVEPAEVLEIMAFASAPKDLAPSSSLFFAIHAHRTEVIFDGSAVQVANHAPELRGPLAKVRRVALELTSPGFRISCYMTTRHTSTRIAVEIKGDSGDRAPRRERHSFLTEDEAIEWIRQEWTSWRQGRI